MYKNAYSLLTLTFALEVMSMRPAHVPMIQTLAFVMMICGTSNILPAS